MKRVWKDMIKNLIIFDPNVPCKDCIIRMICTTICDVKGLTDWSVSKYDRWCKYVSERD